ncbi:MAG: succinate dehydrogenase assembly factor 2 [Rhodovulum sulfidophilum]|uniref:FAD assembly factor SdhE n=1 Tax=Rhodovulum sulfidophilum TaxID=35806 RepID=A0A2W5NA13_RHOSU|nr:MAG: succinate dehydrogenase assembly factor 2 [Rhodovulum sulfidophilum]
MEESAENRLRRLRMRSWRRGTKEMDLILGPFADARLAALDAATLDRYEGLLEENDQDLYLWVSRGADFPAEHGAVIAAVRAFHGLA